MQKPDCFLLIVLQKHLIERALRRCSSKQMILKTMQYSQENACDGVFFNKVALSCLLKRDPNTEIFL